MSRISPYLFLFAFGFFVSKGHGWKQKEPSRGDVCCLWQRVTNSLLGHSNTKVNGRSMGREKRRGEKSYEASSHERKEQEKKKKVYLHSFQNTWNTKQLLRKNGKDRLKTRISASYCLIFCKWWRTIFFCVQEGNIPVCLLPLISYLNVVWKFSTRLIGITIRKKIWYLLM